MDIRPEVRSPQIGVGTRPARVTKGALKTGQRDSSLIVAFGTDMGNSEDAATTFAEAVEAVGIEARANRTQPGRTRRPAVCDTLHRGLLDV
ncbi:MAG: FAD-binding protein [Mycobacterium sp.]|jgi:hypothetical protein|nr:FAD-binding protein [Mycobacterium sp.]